MAPVNYYLMNNIASLFGSDEQSDCIIEFIADGPIAERFEGFGEGVSALEPAASDAHTQQPAGILGEPLPAHTFVLRNASEYFRAKLDFQARERDARERDAAPEVPSPEDSAAAAAVTSPPGGLPPTGTRPVLRVPLGGAAEVPSALAAIRYAYTGRVDAGSVREALETWRQAGYLQVEGCAGCCGGCIRELLSGGGAGGSGSGVHGSGGGAGGSGGGAGGSCSSSGLPPALEFFNWEPLWAPLQDGPDFAWLLSLASVRLAQHCESMQQDPAFAAAWPKAKPHLVSDFGDALETLNCPILRRQLLSLPAAGLEALLESDEFGTDTEDSVLLLLATWMQENRGGTDAATRERLCRLVRLAQLSRDYTSLVLRALAEGYCNPSHSNEGPGWFPISMAEAAAIDKYVNAQSDAERAHLLEVAGEAYNLRCGWYNTKRRQQCLREDSALILDWSLSQSELESELKWLSPGNKKVLKPTLYHAPWSRDRVEARGFCWEPSVVYRYGAAAADVYLYCKIPEAYKRPDSMLLGAAKAAAVVHLDASLEVYRWREGVKEVAFRADYDQQHSFIVNRGHGRKAALPLQQLQGGDRSGAGGAGDGWRRMAAWAEYLHERKMQGRLTILPPSE